MRETCMVSRIFASCHKHVQMCRKAVLAIEKLANYGSSFLLIAT